MSEKETPETAEEQIEKTFEEVKAEEAQEEQSQELEASEDQEESEQGSQEAETEAAPPAPVEKKGLMERRPSYSQSSVPNAHRGYSATPPVIMLLIISVFVLLSIIFATAAIVN